VNERTHLDLFSGIGGFALAAKWNGFRTVGFCDNEPYAQAVLKKHWPDVPIHDDIRKVRGELYAGITLLTGGFPCQPFSVAGKQRGKTDDRYLWPEMLRVIREAGPTWIVGENVAGIVNMALDQVHADLEAEGYEVESIIIPACAVDAPHRRDRVWIVANSTSLRNGGGSCVSKKQRERMVQGKQKRAEIRMQVEGCGLFTDKNVAKSKRFRLERAANETSMGEKAKKHALKGVNLHKPLKSLVVHTAQDEGKGQHWKQTGQLDPVFVEYLMGYPTGWTELKDWAMPSSRKSRQKSSDASSR